MAKNKTKSNEQSSIESQIDGLSVGISINDVAYNSLPLKGKNITLNFQKESFFGVGDIWLQEGNYTCVVPENISPRDEDILRDAVNKGIVVLGDHFIPNVQKDEKVLEEYWDYVKRFGFADSSKHKSFEKFKKLFRYGTDRNWTAKEVVKHCISCELKYKSRADVIKLLNEIYNRLNCPDTLSVRAEG